MPTHTDHHDHDHGLGPTKKRDDPTAWPDERPWYLRIVHAYRRAGVWLGYRVHHTVQWAREQDRSMLAWFWGLAAVSVLLAAAALRLVGALVTGLWNWLFGNDTAEPAPSPQPEAGSDVPGWIAGLDQQPLWTGLWDGIVGWFDHQAAVTGVPMMLLLIAWGAAGGLLLLAAWYGATLTHDIPWWGWLAVTCVLVWTHTPGHSPIPAALVGTVGVVASTVPAAGLLLAFAGTGLGMLIATH